MSWLGDEIRRRQEQEAERQRQEAERRRQAQEAAWRREQEEKPLQNQRSQQLVQMGRQQLNPLLHSLQLPQLLQDAHRHIRDKYQTKQDSGIGFSHFKALKDTSWQEEFHALGNWLKLSEPLRLAGWNYAAWLTVVIAYEDYDHAQGTDSGESTYEMRIRLWRDNLKTRIAFTGFFRWPASKQWEQEIPSSNTSKIVAQLKDSILQEVLEIEG